MSESDVELAKQIIIENLHSFVGTGVQQQRGLLTFWKKEKKAKESDESESDSHERVDSAQSSDDGGGIIEKMREAYDTYSTLAKLRKRTTVSGLAAGALPLAGKALRWYLGLDSTGARWSIGSLSMLFVCGTAVGFAAHSELRWYLRDRSEHDIAKSRALSAARVIRQAKLANKADFSDQQSCQTASSSSSSADETDYLAASDEILEITSNSS